VIEAALRTTTTKQIPETFQLVQLDLPTKNCGLNWKCGGEERKRKR